MKDVSCAQAIEAYRTLQHWIQQNVTTRGWDSELGSALVHSSGHLADIRTLVGKVHQQNREELEAMARGVSREELRNEAIQRNLDLSGKAVV